MSKQSICVALSGGVDSSVAAYLLASAGHNVIGVSMQVWDYRGQGGSASRATCCAPTDFLDARKVAALLDIPYYVFDFEKHFKEHVIDRFVDEYRQGVTPNPCVECNSKVKFRELRQRVQALGFQTVATGHYARVEHTPAGSRLLRGIDRDKDQSYFLYGISAAELCETEFPIGGLTKQEVREIARRANLVTAEKPESQDICFVSGSVQEFVERMGVPQKPGTIVSSQGKVLGTHEGIHRFTVGQRRGVGVRGTGHPLYILELNPQENLVVMGERSELEREHFFVDGVNWVDPSVRLIHPPRTFQACAQLRHRSKAVPVTVHELDNGTLKCSFISEWATVTPGQACVLFDESDTVVLAGGTIVREPAELPREEAAGA